MNKNKVKAWSFSPKNEPAGGSLRINGSEIGVYLVGGWAAPLKKYEFVSWDEYSQYMERHKFHGSKPPTRYRSPQRIWILRGTKKWSDRPISLDGRPLTITIKAMAPGLVNVYITNWAITMLLMGKLTISTGPFSSSQTVCLPEGNRHIVVGVAIQGRYPPLIFPYLAARRAGITLFRT